MVTTYQISSNDLDDNLLNLIKNAFPNQEIIIDVYKPESLDIEINEITNPKIIKRIADIKSNKNLVYPTISL